ncbi:MAG TPA: uracil-DNA glycosylase [Candidatus Dormibacteraeota bacterium]|nr:uracil-DNA glycosylase [Candidatus Dormibacteraeota bacterium]
MADEDLNAELRSVLAGLRAQIEWQRDCGMSWLPLGVGQQPVASRAAVAGAPAVSPPRAAPTPPAPPTGDPALAATASLAGLRDHVGDCQRCKLAGGRTNLVFGVGAANADLMFVGEGPGHDEDLRGEPFVGRAGQLLTEIITKGMKLRREDVYIANVVKCRPPNNRNPESDEIASCMPFLQRQVELVAPRVIVALGTFAAQTLLGVKTPITRMRGNWHEYRGIKVMPTFHPAYLLRTPGDKRLAWADIKLVMAELGLPV